MTATSLNTFDLILFDLDGTLVDTAPEITDSVNDVLQRFDLPHVTQETVELWIGQGTHELLVQALAAQGTAGVEMVRASASLKLASAEFTRCYAQRCGSRSEPYPQVREALTALRARGVKTAVLTNKEAQYAHKVLDAHRLTPLFDRVVCGDSLPVKKPAPDGVLSCLAQFGVTPQRALLLGDSSIDVATARAAGIAVWAVPYGYNRGQPIEDSRPDRVVRGFAALLS